MSRIHADSRGDRAMLQVSRKPQLRPLKQAPHSRILSKAAALKLVEEATKRVSERRAQEEKSKGVEELLAYFTAKLEEPWYLIMPDSKLMGRWDGVTFTSLIFTALVTPYEIAVMTPVEFDGLWFINQLVNLVFFCDLIMAFFTVYREKKSEGGRLVKDLKRIRWNYLMGWFPIDFVSIIPFSYIPGVGSEFGIFRIIRIIRLLKLLRVIKASRLYQRYEAQISLPHSVVALIKFSLLFLIMAHWMACIWILSANFMQSSHAYTWIDSFAETYYCSPDGCELEPARRELFEKGRGRDVYFAAVYWSVVTITSVGYGDITPRNAEEMLICTIYILMGSTFWAYIIGNATAIVSTGDPAAIMHHQTMDELNVFMQDRGFEQPLRMRLRTYFHNSKEISKSAGYQQLVNRLSPKLKADVTERNAAWLKNLSYFQEKNVDRNFLVELSHEIYGSVYEPREVIPYQNSLICVSKGVASRDGGVCAHGSFWGEDFILESDDLKEKQPAQTLTFCELLVLEPDPFFDILSAFPREKRLVRRAAIRMAIHRGILKEARKRIQESTGNTHLDARAFHATIMSKAHDLADDSCYETTHHKKSTEQAIRELLDKHSEEMDEKILLVQDYIQNNMMMISARLDEISYELKASRSVSFG